MTLVDTYTPGDSISDADIIGFAWRNLELVTATPGPGEVPITGVSGSLPIISGSTDVDLIYFDLASGGAWDFTLNNFGFIINDAGSNGVFTLRGQVPVPAAAWLFASALGLAGLAARRKRSEI